MEILKAGDKIKRLRKELGLKQDDITNAAVTRSLISMIENNKRTLSWQTAQIIADCLNQYYKNAGKIITPQFLMETEVDQARNIINTQVKLIEASLLSQSINSIHLYQSIDRLMKLADEWNVEKEMADLLKLRGEIHYYDIQYNDALNDYFNALEYYLSVKDLEQVASIYRLIGMAYEKQGLLQQALMYYFKSNKVVIENNTTNKDTVMLSTIVNIIICYRKLKKYDMVFEYIKLFNNLPYYDDISYNEVLIMEANTYRDLKNYHQAEKIYDKLLLRVDRLDSNTLFRLYNNCGNLHRKKGNISQAIDYIDEALKLEGKIRPPYLLDLYREKAKCLILIKEYNKALSVLEKGLQIAEGVVAIESIIDYHLALAEVYMLLRDFHNAKKHLEISESLILGRNIKSKIHQLYSRYAELYCHLNQQDLCLEYIIKLQVNRMS
ncbi:helix-turn-helix domain-containing protein [Alkaliphilus transvaalensis]|uniref:helix-turn-helix domain-containing protein n=1 Tax=Alkaliphilus transvaalensis TaxID=114628 RepID=UPI00047E77E5|nr:tetratricopeptide repeat protein [Alkaliphilus transvaalensis]